MTTVDPRARRLAVERRCIQNDPIDGVLVTWQVSVVAVEITAPEDSLYHGDVFRVDIDLDGYPRLTPRVSMQTPIFHPNIDSHGAVCVACLRSNWHQTVKVRDIILEIIDAIRHPNPDDALSPEAATMMKTDMPRFEETVREQVAKNQMSRGE